MLCMKTWEELNRRQPLASKIMTNSIRNNRISHAYLINGARGTGKKELAILLAMTLFCKNKGDLDPCGECRECKRILSRNHPDVYWVERETQFITKDQIDGLRRELSHISTESDKKLYIITEADALNITSANSLLKILEEPEPGMTAILLTSNVRAIIPTIQSRCQLIDLLPLDQREFQSQLTTLLISENNARLLSGLTNNIDEALIYNEAAKVYVMRDLVVQLIEVLMNRYTERYLFIHQRWLAELKDKEEIEMGLDILLLAVNDIVKYQVDVEGYQAIVLGEELLSQSTYSFSQKQLLKMLSEILATKQKIKRNVHATLAMEALVLQL